jgi:cytochrome b6-f complex iron-sulfur subunit
MMQRRNFIRKISVTLASVAGALAGISFLKQCTHGRSIMGRKARVGRIADFPVDTYTFVEEQKIFVYRDHEGVRAVSAVCTHLGCTVLRTTDGFECPCHGSCYSDTGDVLSGPAPTALDWYRVEKAPDGVIVVDMNETASADDKFHLT